MDNRSKTQFVAESSFFVQCTQKNIKNFSCGCSIKSVQIFE